MLKILWRDLHQSYFVVAFCAGVIAGVVLGLVFRVNYFGSMWWCVLAVILLVFAYFKPKFVFFVVAFLAGMIVAFFRVAEFLASEKQGMHEEMVMVGGRTELENLVLGVRDWFAARIERLVPETEAKLGLSYLLGMKSGLPDDLNESLRVVGLTHIVVASGAHLSILVEVSRKIFGRISRFAGLMFSVMFIVFFMAMVGWTPSILRAGIMAILTLVTWYVGRKIAPWRMILMVMAGTLVVEPDFITNLGWLLSFASYVGIMVLGPKMQKFFYGEKKPDFVGSMVLTTMSATIMTLPITLYYFGQVSLISVVANLLILPTLPWAMGLTFATGVVAGIPGVEVLVSWLATKMLDFHIGVVGFLGEMKQFLVKIGPYQAWVFVIYVLIVVVFYGEWLRPRNVKKLIERVRTMDR